MITVNAYHADDDEPWRLDRLRKVATRRVNARYWKLWSK
jgi:hypothetical protein